MDRTDDNSPNRRSALSASSSPMRRVFSHDCVRRPLRSGRSGRRAPYRNLVQPPEEAAWLGLSLGGPTPSSSDGERDDDDDDDDIPSCKASKFSSVANRNKLEANRRRLSLPQPRSSTSLDASHHSVDLSLTGPARTNDDDLNEGIFGADMAMLPAPHGRLRFGPMLNLAVLALLFVATVADVAFDLRNARLFGKGGSGGGGGGSYGNANNADYKFFYDDLSTETIVPPSRSRLGGGSVHHHSTGKGGKRPRKVGLGSAMIGSVTTALSPILPFAGGVDLRRGEHWGLRKGDGDDVAAESVASSATGWFASSYKLSGWIWSSTSPGDDGAAESTDDAASSSSMSYASRLVAGVPRGGGTGASTKKNGGSAKANKQKAKSKRGTKQRQQRDAVLAAPEPYLSTEDIAELTLGDIALAFRYAIESGREGFDAETFRSTGGNDGEPLDKRAVRLIDAMDEVAAKSRGPNVLAASTARPSTSVDDAEDSDGPNHPLPSAAGYGDVDALQFCAAMRLLAEWRVIRQVPEGYKGYAVGMGLGHKDVVQNVAKIEAAVHDLIDIRLEEREDDDEADMERRWDETSCANADDGEEAPTCEAGANTKKKAEWPTTPPVGPRSPTLREVLQYEIDDGVQVASKLPRLKEKSAGMGLLWVRRQLHYQTEIFHNMKLIPTLYQDAIEAVKAAYSEVYDRYHGWAVQKIFNYSFQAAPDVDVIYRHMNPRKLKEVTLAAMNGDVDGDDVDKGYDESEVRFASAVSEAAVAVEEEEESSVTEAVMGTSSTGLDEDTVASTISADSSNSSAFEVDGTIDDLDQASILEDAKVTEASHRTPSSNPWVRFGSHVASEWDKLAHHVGGEWDKLAQHVGGEWDKLAHHVGGECDKLGRHIGGEWDKLASNVGRLFHHGKDGGRARSAFPTDIRGGGPRKSTLSGDDLERYLSEQMERDAQRHIVRYLSVARPLLDDLAGLFDELNMDDPTKV